MNYIILFLYSNHIIIYTCSSILNIKFRLLSLCKYYIIDIKHMQLYISVKLEYSNICHNKLINISMVLQRKMKYIISLYIVLILIIYIFTKILLQYVKYMFSNQFTILMVQ